MKKNKLNKKIAKPGFESAPAGWAGGPGTKLKYKPICEKNKLKKKLAKPGFESAPAGWLGGPGTK